MAASGVFSLADASLTFVLVAVGGLAVGVALLEAQSTTEREMKRAGYPK